MTTPTHPLKAIEQALLDAPDVPHAWIPLRRETVAALLSHLTRAEKKLVRIERMVLVMRTVTKAWDADDEPDEPAAAAPSMGVQLAQETLKQIETAMQPEEAAGGKLLAAGPETEETAPATAPTPPTQEPESHTFEPAAHSQQPAAVEGGAVPAAPTPDSEFVERLRTVLSELCPDGRLLSMNDWERRKPASWPTAQTVTRQLCVNRWSEVAPLLGLRYAPETKPKKYRADPQPTPPAPAVPRPQPVPLAVVQTPSPSQQLTMTVRKLPKIEPDVLRSALQHMAASEYGFLPTAHKWDKERPEDLPAMHEILRGLGLKDMAELARWAQLRYSPPANREGVLRAVAKQHEQDAQPQPVTA